MNLADRIRGARQDLDLTQAGLARTVGVDIRTVQGWESEGRRPRGKAARELGRVLAIDLNEPVGTAPRLDEATDAQLLAELSSRLGSRALQIAELTAQAG